MLNKLSYLIITFILIILVLNFLKKQTYESYENNSFTIPENIKQNYNGKYFTNNSYYSHKFKIYFNTLHLNLKNNTIFTGRSIKNQPELMNKRIPIINFIAPSTIISENNNVSIVIDLLVNNNINFNYKLNNSNTWNNANPENIDYLKKIELDRNEVTLTKSESKKVSIPEMEMMNRIK